MAKRIGLAYTPLAGPETRPNAGRAACRALPTGKRQNSSNSRTADALKKAVQPAMVQVAPGRYVPANEQELQEYCLCRWQKMPEGNYMLIPENVRLVRLTAQLGHALGFPGQHQTIYRLGRAGFIEVVWVSPQCAMLNLDSWFNHLRRCAEDPEFWDPEGDNRKLYSENCW